LTTIGTVTSIWFYPIKSMLGHEIESAQISELGIDGDRRLALRDLASGKILSGKNPTIGRKLLALSPRSDDSGIVVDVDGTLHSVAEPDELNTALSSYLGRDVELTAAPREGDVYESYWPEIEGVVLSDVDVDLPIAMSTRFGTFVDLAALHIMADSTIAALDKEVIENVVDRRRFRPSITIGVDTTEPFIENTWTDRAANIGDVTLNLTGPTPRCAMVTLEQPGLDAAKPILQTLAATNRQTLAGIGDFACAGIYAEVVAPGTIKVGDVIRIT
jgi:uncharacterized protein